MISTSNATSGVPTFRGDSASREAVKLMSDNLKSFIKGELA